MKIDKNERLKLPCEVLKLLNIKSSTNLKLTVEDNMLLIKKSNQECIFCSGTLNLIAIGKYFVCDRCRVKLAKVKAGEMIY